MELEVQRPGIRSNAIGSLALGALGALVFAVSDTPEPAFAFALLIPIAIRIAMTRTWIEDDRLHTRNFWRTYVFDRSEISNFVVVDDLGGRAARPRTVWARLADQRLRRLAATRRVYRSLPPIWLRPEVHNRADDICDDLNTWLRGGA